MFLPLAKQSKAKPSRASGVYERWLTLHHWLTPATVDLLFFSSPSNGMEKKRKSVDKNK